MKKLLALLTVFVLVSVAVGCAPGPVVSPSQVTQKNAPTSPEHKRPYWPTQEWQVSTPEEQSMNRAILDQIGAYVQETHLEADSVVVVRHGYIVYEKYFRAPWDKDRVHNIHSCTKSVTGSLVGIALEQGKIRSLNDKMTDYFPARTIQNLDERKKSVTLFHLITMRGGFDWAEQTYPYTDPRNPIFQALRSNDTVQFVLDRPMATQPGRVWTYNGGFSHLFSAIITDQTGMNTMEFARKNLFDPLGITRFVWRTDRRGLYDGAGGLSMTPRDMAKYGYLILNKGVWEGRQIVPAKFIAESVKTQTRFTDSAGYGFHSWWTVPREGYYYASGVYGQEIYVIEKKDLVVVTTAGLKQDSQTETKMRRIAQYAISACK